MKPDIKPEIMPNFKDQGHHGGMPGADYLRWVARMERAAMQERYGVDAFPAVEATRTISSDQTPAAEVNPTGMPKVGTIDFRTQSKGKPMA